MSNSSPILNTLWVCLATLLIFIGGAFWANSNAKSSEVITLHGACQFDDTHTYAQALIRFIELVQQYYQGPEHIEFILHKNSELGTEKDYFGYMHIGAVVDFAITSPSHGATFSRMISIMDVPFLFRDVDHYRKAMESHVFQRVEQQISDRADVLVLGYGGGEKRHFFGRKPVRTMEELKGFDMRVMGSPIQSKIFSAVGASPTVISGSEVYNAIQTGVIEGAENSASALHYFKWYEVAQEVSLSTVSIIVRPLLFSGKRFRKLPPDLQQAIRRAGREAMEFERELEIETDGPLMQKLAEEGKVKLYEFEEREELLRLARPVQEAYAKEVGAYEVYQAIQEIQ